MSNIKMCSGLGCDLKHECYRHMAKGSHLKPFFSEPPIKNGKCDYFWGFEIDNDSNEIDNYER
jgi:hypothetical protein